MTTWQNYHLASNLSEALTALTAAPGPNRPVAGGTDLLLDIQQGRHPPVHTLVDVSGVPEMNLLEIQQGKLFVGAALPLNQIVSSPLIQEHAQALFEACNLIGGPQVRNVATLGGNVSHALPAADGTIALLALEAQAEIFDETGSQTLPVEKLFAGPGRSALKSSQLLVGFHLPLRIAWQGSAFRRVMRPQGVAIAILNMAAWVELHGDTIFNVHISIGPAGPTPLRARAAEETLRGQKLSPHSLTQALDALLAEARFRTSPHRAMVEYRRHLAGVLLEETLLAACQRASSPVTTKPAE
jgi:carbon-monoxide dehydrogenase medium subunit